MYTYRVETMYDTRIPQTWLPGFAPLGLALHWTAGGPGRQGALDTRTFFMNTAVQRNASYHLLIYWEPVLRVFGAIWIVDPRAAAHSIAPQPVSVGGSYNPNAEVRRILGTKVNDPNAACLAVSFAGMPADLEAALADPDFIAGFRRLIKDLLVIPSLVDRPLFNHGWAQPTTRYDAGEKLIPLLYEAAVVPTPEEDDMLFWLPVQEDWDTAAGTVFYDGAGLKKTFDGVTRLRSFAEDSTGRWRLVRYGANEYLVVDARTKAKEGPGLTGVPGSRVPATGYGFPPAPTPETITVVKEVEKIVEVPDPNAVADERARIRGILGL